MKSGPDPASKTTVPTAQAQSSGFPHGGKKVVDSFVGRV
jgi:hypothetical protein